MNRGSHPTGRRETRVSGASAEVLVLILVAVAFTTTCKFGRFSKEVSSEKLKQVEKLANEIPKFPDFQEVGSNLLPKTDTILISKYFVSKAPYEEVGNFYVRLLTDLGWRVVEERPLSVWGTDYGGKELTFIKGELLISIQYEGVRKTGRNYAIAYVWDSPEFRQRVRRYPWLNEIAQHHDRAPFG